MKKIIAEQKDERIDSYLAKKVDLSRVTITKLIDSGNILVNNKTIKPSYKIQYDDVINQQREVVYEKRNAILDSESIHEEVIETIKDFIYTLVKSHLITEVTLTDKDISEILEYVNENLVKNKIKKSELEGKNDEEVIDIISEKVIVEYNDKVKDIPLEVRNEFEKAITLRVVDTYWMEHINTMAILREGIGLRGYAQENPLRAYTNEGFELFDELLANIDKQATLYLLNAEIRQNTERKQVEKPIATNDGKETSKKQPKKVSKIGRNEPCTCGSGKKFKQCCGK